MLTATWASRPVPGSPFSIGSGSLGAITTWASQHLQAYFGRTCSRTTRLAGTYSSCSRVSSPILRRSRPHSGQARSSGATSWTIRLRGRLAGSGLRPPSRGVARGRLRVRGRPGCRRLDDFGGEEEQLGGVDGLALLAEPLAEELLELVLELGDEQALPAQGLGLLAELEVGGGQVVGE